MTPDPTISPEFMGEKEVLKALRSRGVGWGGAHAINPSPREGEAGESL